MRKGPFLLITRSKKLLDTVVSGVIAPAEVTHEHLLAAKAVLLDLNLATEERQELRNRALSAGLPVFGIDSEQEQTNSGVERPLWNMLAFLEEQNSWEQEQPSPQTIDRLELRMLVDIITTANSHLKPREVMESVMNQVQSLIPCEAWSVLILDDHKPDTLRFEVSAGPIKDELAAFEVPFGVGIAGWAAKYRQPLLVHHAQSDPRFMNQIDKEHNFLTRNILCAPLISRGRTIGVLEMLNRAGAETFTEADLELVQTLVNPAAVAIENAFLFQKTNDLTIQDDLTKLYNSRHLNQCLELEVKRAKRHQLPLSVLFLDLDGFKAVNDRYGHLLGSQTLVDIGSIIKTTSRTTDIVGRYGGDEFMVIFPNTDVNGAILVAERIRTQVEAYRVKDLHVTASIGIASYPEHGSSRAELMSKADKAMYKVKELGKNGIVIAEAHG